MQLAFESSSLLSDINVSSVALDVNLEGADRDIDEPEKYGVVPHFTAGQFEIIGILNIHYL
jgi:hypothetical protein